MANKIIRRYIRTLLKKEGPMWSSEIIDAAIKKYTYADAKSIILTLSREPEFQEIERTCSRNHGRLKQTTKYKLVDD